MQSPRGPRWVYGTGACVLGFLLLNTYADLGGPGAIGMDLRFRRHQALVVAVAAGSRAAGAGIEPGDWIISVRGEEARSLFHWRAALGNTEVGRPLPLEIERNGIRRDVSLQLDANWRGWTAANWMTFGLKLAAQIVTFGLALLIAVRRPRDHVAVIGALFLAALSVTNFEPTTGIDPHSPSLPYGAAAIWRGLPPWLGAPLWVGFLVFAMGPLSQLQFFAEFPRPVFRTARAWWIWSLAWSPAVVLGIPGLLYYEYCGVYDPGRLAGALPDWFTPFIGAAVVAAIVVGMVVLVINYRRLADRNERRRLRVLVLGALVGVAGVTPVAMASFLDLPTWLGGALRSPVVLAGSSALFLVLPVSFAYAVLRHQIFDVRLILRQGLQYALARRLVVSLVPACAVVLGIDLFVHGDQPLASIVLSRGWIYAAVAGLAWAAHLRRQGWLEALDRRFFRERYDAQRLMLKVVEDIRHAADLQGVGPRVVAQIASALHPEYVALLVRAPGDAVYRVLASVPADGVALSLSGDSKVAALVGLLGRPLDLGPGQSGWIRQQLPPEEAELVRRERIGLLVPVATPAEGSVVLLALGQKRSEEPYSREDQGLLVAIAASLSLLIDRPASRASVDSFGECPRCGACDDSGAAVCAHDGAALDRIQLPRLLAQRYRLERRLGRGGMGTVYEAADTTLERRVAVKVIREDLVTSAAAADRFRIEARAAASFSHPNVVTVHDFGVARGTRAFLVMELLRGTTLRDELRAASRLAPARTLAILRDLAAAVDAAHARQLVHRDLKPENVALVGERKDQVKLLDFGLAKSLAGLGETGAETATGPGVIAGTVHYMGPEQLRGGVGVSCDLWAIAVMAYEMLTGALPFSGASAGEYQASVLSGQFTPIRIHLPDAPEPLQAFFAGALAPEPSRRPGHALLLVGALDRALA
jgi:eukaryotic-like serine/threonine-protein kinase